MSLSEQTVLFIRNQFEQILKQVGQQAEFNPSAEGAERPPFSQLDEHFNEERRELNWDADDEQSDNEDAVQLSQTLPLPDDQQQNHSDHHVSTISTFFSTAQIYLLAGKHFNQIY